MTKKKFSDPIEGPKQWFSLCNMWHESLKLFREMVVDEHIRRRGSAREEDIKLAVENREMLNQAYRCFKSVKAQRFTVDERKKADADILYFIDALIRKCDVMMSRYQNMEDLR